MLSGANAACRMTVCDHICEASMCWLQAAWYLKARALTMQVWVDDLDDEDEVRLSKFPLYLLALHALLAFSS